MKTVEIRDRRHHEQILRVEGEGDWHPVCNNLSVGDVVRTATGFPTDDEKLSIFIRSRSRGEVESIDKDCDSVIAFPSLAGISIPISFTALWVSKNKYKHLMLQKNSGTEGNSS